MSEPYPPKNDQGQPSPMTDHQSKITQKVWDTVETARDLIARAHQALDTTQRLIKAKAEILQYNQARREHQAEKAASHVLIIPQAAIDILLITDNAGDVARFLYALRTYTCHCQMKVLTDRRDVETFVRQATTTAYPLPRLIIIDIIIPGMEAEDIVAAVRSVPAYHRIPVILFSALMEAEGERHGVLCGATVFVHKPGKFEDFITVVLMMIYLWSGVGEDLDPNSEQERHDEREEIHETDID